MKQLTPCSFWAEHLAATHLDDLSSFERVALERHIASCPACAAIRAEYEAMGRKISQLPTVEPRPGIPAGLLKLWNKQAGGAVPASLTPKEDNVDAASAVPQSMPSLPPRQKRRNSALIPTIAAVLILAVLVGGLLTLYTSHRAQPAGQSQTGTWELITSPSPGTTENKLYAVAAISSNDAWAVGDTSSSHDAPAPLYTPLGSNTLIEHWNGRQWSVIPSPNPPSPKSPHFALNTLNSVSAVSASDVWAVGTSSDDYLISGLICSITG